MLFRTLLVINVLAGLVLLFFFLWGLSDGTALYALGTWLLIIAVAAGCIFGGLVAHRNGNKALGVVLMLPLAFPAFFYGLFLLLVIVLQPRWN